MSLAVWSRFSDFCMDVISSRSLYEVITLINIIVLLPEEDRSWVLGDIAQRLAFEDADLYRWFCLEIMSSKTLPEQKAALAEQMNINIAEIQKLNKNEDNYNGEEVS